MAENEYLDSSKSRRWHAVAKAICSGASTEDIADSIYQCLCKTLRQIGREIPLASLIRAAPDMEAFDQVCAGIEGADTVKDFLRQAFVEHVDREGAMRQFLEFSLENCLYDVPWLTQKIDGELSISETRRRLNAARSQLAPKFNRMAKKFAANPDLKPRCVGDQRKRSGTQSATEKMLSESLISGSSKR